MARMTEEQKKKEFQENFKIMKDSAEGRKVYNTAFADQSNVENLLASGGGEELGPLDKELASLFAMNAIRESERDHAFTQDTLFEHDIKLGMRDASYVDATAEIRRRKDIKSHRWEKTRKKRMKTSRETLSLANDKIRAIKEKLHPAQGQPQMTAMQRVEAMKSVYDQIRIADRNCAEAMALSADEEKRLKNKAELTYCKSMNRMLEREMSKLDPQSREYAKLRSIADLNTRSYNELKRKAQQTDHVEINDQDIKNKQEGPVLMDKEAEDLVSADVRVFDRFKATLDDAKYGDAKDQLWAQMKAKAAALTSGWDQKSDLDRGDALADLLIAANRLMCKEGRKNDTDKAREDAAGEVRSFFKSVLKDMSLNCRVMALERIFKKADALEEDPETSEMLKKANRSVFAELARDKYKNEKPGIDDDHDALKMIDDTHYRYNYEADRQLMHTQNVLHIFGDTKEFLLADIKFKFNRHLGTNELADSFRLDRFGNVLEEDTGKKEQWAKLISDIAAADTKKAKELLKNGYARLAKIAVDPEWFTEEGVRKHACEINEFRRRIFCREHLANNWRTYNQAEVLKKIRKWNADHPQDRIPEESIKDPGIKVDELSKVSKEMDKLPAIKSRCDLEISLDFGFMKEYTNAIGIRYGAGFDVMPSNSMKTRYELKKFLKDGGSPCSYDTGDTNAVGLIHQDGTEFDQETDLDSRGMLVRNAEDPLMYKYESLLNEAHDKAMNITETEDLIAEYEHIQRVKELEDTHKKISAGSAEKVKEIEKKLERERKELEKKKKKNVKE